MSKKQEYIDKMRGQLEGFNAKIEILKTGASKADSSFQPSYHSTIEELTLKRQVVESKLHQLENAEDDNWEDLKEEMEKAWADFSTTIKAANARFT